MSTRQWSALRDGPVVPLEGEPLSSCCFAGQVRPALSRTGPHISLGHCAPCQLILFKYLILLNIKPLPSPSYDQIDSGLRLCCLLAFCLLEPRLARGACRGRGPTGAASACLGAGGGWAPGLRRRPLYSPRQALAQSPGRAAPSPHSCPAFVATATK